MRLTGFSISAGRRASRQEERESGIPADSRQGKIFMAGRKPMVCRGQGIGLKIEQQVMKFQNRLK